MTIDSVPELMRLYNRTQKVQILNVRGKQFTIEGFEEKTFDADIAKLFLASCDGNVVSADVLLASNIEEPVKPETMWIANVTGNPDAPKQIREKVYRGKNQGWLVETVDNIAARPVELSCKIPGAWVEYTDKYGQLISTKKPPISVVLPPYKRIEVLRAIGENFLTRIRGSIARDADGKMYPKATRCNAPRIDEPTYDWSLDELQNWLCFVDPKVIVEDSEEKIRAKLKKNPKVTEAQIAFTLEDVKRRVFKRVFFRLVDPSVKIPTRREFLEFMGVTKPGTAPSTELTASLLADAAKE